MQSQHVLAIFMVQGASSGVIGALVGGLLGVLLAANLNSLMEALGVALFRWVAVCQWRLIRCRLSSLLFLRLY